MVIGVVAPPVIFWLGRHLLVILPLCASDALRPTEGPIRRTREGGSEWEPIKILLEGDRCSNKMNTTSNTRLRLNYPSWSRPRSHWSATDPRNQQTTFRAKTHKHTQRKLARLAACATPVRPVACADQTGDTGQTGGQSWSGRWLHQPHNKCSKEPQ
jgi:hypothetical protein